MSDLLEMGNDIRSDWSFTDGDLNLIKYKDNIIQSIINRLNTEYDTYNLFYGEYGGFLMKFMGWKRNSETLRFMEKEIVITLQQDPRLQNVTVNLEYGDKGRVTGNLYIVFDDDTDLSASLVLAPSGVEIEEEEEV